jgi:hypothetical protein
MCKVKRNLLFNDDNGDGDGSGDDDYYSSALQRHYSNRSRKAKRALRTSQFSFMLVSQIVSLRKILRR